MTTSLPAPLTPPDCDLRDFAFMPVDVVRLRDCDLAAHPDAEVFRTAVLSWSAAWHQVPAASLPDDDAAIARLVGMGRNVKGFTKLRTAGALHGFVKCSDGRLYHGVVAEKAITAWMAKDAQRNRTAKARDARLSQRLSQNKTPSVTETVTDDTNQSKGEVRDRDSKGIQKEQEAVPAPVVPKRPPIPAFELPPDIPVEPFADFVEMRLKMRKPMTDKAKRNLVAKLRELAAAGQDMAAVLDQSVTRSWTTVYRIKPEGSPANGDKPASKSFGSSIGRVIESRAERGFAFEAGGGDSGAPDAIEDQGSPGDGNPQLRLTAQA